MISPVKIFRKEMLLVDFLAFLVLLVMLHFSHARFFSD